MSTRTGSYDESKGKPGADQSAPRRVYSPRGPRPVSKHGSSTEKGPIQVRKAVTEPTPYSASERWTSTETVSSPTEYSLPTSPASQDGSLPRLEPVRQASLEPLRSGTPISVASAPASASKWVNLRHHVLNLPVRPSTPSQPPTRFGTPKPFRLQKLVEDMEGGKRRFSEDILRACNIARYGEIQRPSKEREASASSQTSNPSARKLDYLRRPLSVASLSSTQSSSPPSLRYLYQVLVHYSTNINTGQSYAQLPYESRVLSTLLCPFLSHANYPVTGLEEEQLTAMDAFELLSNSWTPADEGVLTDRLLWCAKAAATMRPHPARTRLLTSLRKQFLPSSEGPGLRLSVHSFRSLTSNIFFLLASLHIASPQYQTVDQHRTTPLQSPSSPVSVDLQDSIDKVLSGSLEVDEQSIVEEYGAKFSSADNRSRNIRALSIEGLLHCIENCPETGEWLLQNTIEQYWPAHSADEKFTKLQGIFCSRRLDTFCRIFQISLRSSLNTSWAEPLSHNRVSSATSSSSLDAANLLDSRLLSHLIFLLQTRVLPEAEALGRTGLDDQTMLQLRTNIARLMFDLTHLSVGGPVPRSPRDDVFGGSVMANVSNRMEHVKWAVQVLAGWYKIGTALPWRAVLEGTLQQLIQAGWETSVPVLLSLLKHMPDDVKKNVMSTIFPSFNDQLVSNPPPYPYPEMTTFLSTLSRTWPPLFYKPLYACAASDKEVNVGNHLCTIQVHAKYVQDYWTHNPDMLCTALLADIGMSDTGSKDDKWAKARLGQLVVLVELIGKIQKLRHEKEHSSTEFDSKFSSVSRFASALETQLWEMMKTKEKKLLIPPSQRMLLCILLREFRLLTRSVKPAIWLSTTLQWFDDFCADEHMGMLDQEVTESMQRVQGLYMAGQSGQQIHKGHTSMLAKSVLKSGSEKSNDNHKILDLAATFVEHRKLIDSLSKGYIPRAMKLFVTMSVLIPTEDYRRLGTTLWQHCLLDNVDTSATASASFLLMRCAEKTPMDILPAIEVDLHASDDITRLEAVRKIAVLVNWRYQISTQNFLIDRSHRPFKLGRPPLPFLATDLGSSHYVPVEEVKQTGNKDDVPTELRKRLEELGWVEEDAKPVDPREEIIQAPLSILPLDQMDRMEIGTGEGLASSNSPLPTPQPSPRRNQTQQILQTVDDAAALLRRNSSTGGPTGGLKRKAIFVPPLSSIFEHLSRLVFDINLSIASAARTTLLDIMRSDPALLSRTVLDQLAGENKDVRFAMSTFSALLHVRRILPPPLAHYLFNNLGGFLKYVMKHIQTSEALGDFAQVMPVITSLAVQVSGLSLRGIRRSKMEYIFTPSGSLWFSPSAPKSFMLPRMLQESKFPARSVPPQLFSISMIRTSQNLFFLAILKRNYNDVQAIRKNMSTLVLPSLDEDSKALELRDFVPGKAPSQTAFHRHPTIGVLSLMVARSHILLVAQIFRSLPRHLSDRSELAILVDGLNRCLLAHGDDIGIVSHVLIALMVASARFRRLFLTGDGYALFMPALVKVYTEQPAHLGIRSAIEYAISRFYVLHKEPFLYQSIHIIGQLAMLPEVDAASFSKGVFDLFASLAKQITPSSVDVAGIHDVNKAEEREAYLFHTANETPQAFLAVMRRKDSQSGLQTVLQLPHDYGEAQLDMDDFVRLLLTVIDHDLTISRAQHFLRLLRYCSPYLYNASASTRTILADGIMVLGTIFTKAFSKPRGGELPKPLPESEDEPMLATGPRLENLVNETTRTPSESKTMRMDFLYLVLAFGQAGGTVSPLLTSQVIDVTRSLLKDWAEAGYHDLAVYLNNFLKMVFIREEPLASKGVVAVLHRLAPIFHAFMTVDFTGVFETILRILPVPIYLDDPAFSHVIVGDICSAGLAACDLAVSENRLMDLPYRPTFVCLLAEAIFLHDVDIIAELEKRHPSHQFLAGVILPLVLIMKTGAQIVPDSTRTDFHRFHRMQTNAWIRLLFYSIFACQRSQRDDDAASLSGSVRSKSSDGRVRDGRRKSHLSTLAVGLQVLKVIIVRGADDISSVPRLGVWERLSSFLRVILAEGTADFALKQQPSSTATTPTGSPRASTQIDIPGPSSGFNLFVSTSSSLNPPGSSLFSQDRPKPFSHPRILDYCLWSVLEFVCAYNSPLRMHLRLLATEKVLAINQELRQGARQNGTSFPSSPSIRRLSASIGLRARHRASARDVPSPSPDSSPYLHPSQSNLSPSLSYLSPSPPRPSPSITPAYLASPALDIPQANMRRPGYAISPVTPQDRAPNWPKIVHLGPTSPSAFLPAPSPLVGLGLRRFSRASTSQAEPTTRSHSIVIQSEPLCQETYRRIRRVQASLGYSNLLPLPLSKPKFDSDESEDVFLLAWTKSQAINFIVQETNALLEEFDESSQNETSSITFDIEPSTPAPISPTTVAMTF